MSMLNNMFLKEGEPGEIKKIINNSDIKKPSDIFDITPKLLKAASEKTIEPLTYLFNETIKKRCSSTKAKNGCCLSIQLQTYFNLTFSKQNIQKTNTRASDGLFQ